jgi:hypothetical protein
MQNKSEHLSIDVGLLTVLTEIGNRTTYELRC